MWLAWRLPAWVGLAVRALAWLLQPFHAGVVGLKGELCGIADCAWNFDGVVEQRVGVVSHHIGALSPLWWQLGNLSAYGCHHI